MILNDILIKNAQDFPDKLACRMLVDFRNFTLTYNETYLLAQKFARLLENHGIGKGDPVLICAPNSPFWTVVFWGCLLKGAVVVPLNIQSTADMITAIIEQTKARILFNYSHFKLKFDQLITYHTDLLDEILADIPTEFTKPNLQSNDLFEIMYTSGTTGHPKGVMLSHGNVVSNLTAIDQVIQPDPKQDRLLSILPLSHIYEQTIGLLLPALHQIEVIYAHSHHAIRPLLKENCITKILAVPEFLQLFMAKIEANLAKSSQITQKFFRITNQLSLLIKSKSFSRILFWPVRRQFGSALETIASGGAPLSAELEQKWQALGITILQGYGLTETSPVVTTNTYDRHRLGSVGLPLANVKVKLDEIGQILVKGPNVFQGYYQDSKSTERVLTDGWFNTEDIGQFDQDQFLYIRGRKKYMLKGPGGQNVYPEDIEGVLANFPDLRDSCVIGLDDRIHAVLLLANPQANVAEIIKQANQKLASYQAINSWDVWPLEDFPRTATRKIKKTEVEKLITDQSLTAAQVNGQKLAMPNKLTKLIAHLANVTVNKIQPQTKIVHELNLDSLARVELINTIEEEFDATINEADLTQDLTLQELEELIERKPAAAVKLPLKRWPRQWWAKILRAIFQTIFIQLTRLYIQLKVEGVDNLKKIDRPAIFMMNHVSYLDGSTLCLALPWSLRKKLSFAAARDFLYEQLRWLTPFAELLFNTFPIQRDSDANIKLGLEYIGKILDQGYSVGIFPEGAVSRDGNLLPLKAGTGLIAGVMRAPIIPVKIIGIEKVLPYEKYWPRHRGPVTVKFGQPMYFKRTDDHNWITEQIQKAIADL